MAGTTSQPAISALVSATDHSERETGLSLSAINALEPYWEATRRVYAPFESGLPSPTGRVYRHEIPGGQLSNLRQQAIALGLGEKFEQVEDMYAAANDILGNIVKVTPSSKVVGDLALYLVGIGADPAEFADDPAKFDIPDSVIGFLNGELGDPPGGWPEPFRTKALEGRTWKKPSETLTPEQEEGLAGSQADRRSTLNELLFPGPTKDFRESRERYGDVSLLPTLDYLYGLRQGEEHPVELGEGKTLILGVQAISDARRARLPHPDGPDQRPAAPDQRPRHQRRLRGRRHREGRHRQARPRRGAVPGRGHGRRWPRATRSRPATPSRPSRR